MLSPTQTLRLGELLRLFEAENAAEAPPNDGVPTSAEAEAPLAAPLADEALSPAHPTPSTPLPTLSQAVFALPMDDLITLLAKCPHCALEVPTAAVPFHAVVEESEFWSTPRSQAAEEALVAFDSANPSDPFAVGAARLAARAAHRRVTARVGEVAVKRREWMKGVEQIVRLNNKFAIRTGVLAVSEPHDEALSIVRRGMDDHPVERRQIAAMKLETRRIESIWSSPQLVPPPPEEWERLWDGDLADPDAVFAGAADVLRPTLKARETSIWSTNLFLTLPPEIISMILEQGARNTEAATQTPSRGAQPWSPAPTPIETSSPATRRQTFLKVTSLVSRNWLDLSQAKLAAFPHFRTIPAVDSFVALLQQTGRRNLVRKVTIQLGDIFTSEEKKRRSYPLYKTACNALANLWSEFEFEEVREVELCGNGLQVLEYRTAVKNLPQGPPKLPRPGPFTFLPHGLTTLSLIDFNFGFSNLGTPLILFYLGRLPLLNLTILRGRFEDEVDGRPDDLRFSKERAAASLPTLLSLTLDDSFPIPSLLSQQLPGVNEVTLTRPKPPDSEHYRGWGQPAPAPRPKDEILTGIYALPGLKILRLPGSEAEALWGESATILAKVEEGVEVRWEM